MSLFLLISLIVSLRFQSENSLQHFSEGREKTTLRLVTPANPAGQPVIFSENMPFERRTKVNAFTQSECFLADNFDPSALQNSFLPLPFSLAQGIQTLDFEVNRTTFGFTDENFTQPFDPDLAAKNVALGCDSVQMRVSGVVGTSTLQDSIGLLVSYDNPDGSLLAADVFQFAGGNVRIVQGGIEFFCPVDNSSLTISALAGNKQLSFDLDACLTAAGLTLNPGDSIEFIGNFSVNPQGPFPNALTPVGNFTAGFFSIEGGQSQVCNTVAPAGQFLVGKYEADFSFPADANQFPSGCMEGELSWRLELPGNDFGAFFGNELRPAQAVDSIVLDFDMGILTAFGAEVTVSIPGHPVFGDAFFPVRSLDDFPDGHYVARFDTLNYVPSLNSLTDRVFELKIRLLPTCESSAGSADGDNLYGISSGIFFTERNYAAFIGDGTCASLENESGLTTLFYDEPPAFTLSTAAPADTLENGIAEWVVQLCNTSTSAESTLNWLSVEDPNGVLSVISMENVNDPANPIVLPLLAFGSDVFAFLPALLPDDNAPPETEHCISVRIRAATSDCSGTDFMVKSGWNCGAYEEQNWTPALYPPCSGEQLPLSLVNLSATPFQLAFQNSQSFCTGNIFEEIEIHGIISSAVNIPSQDFMLRFYRDINGDGIVQSGETLLHQQQVTGSVSPLVPFQFSFNFEVLPGSSCVIIGVAETGGASVCATDFAGVPTPTLLIAGDDQFFCKANGPILTTGIGDPLCDSPGYTFNWTAIAPASISDLSNPIEPFTQVNVDWASHQGQVLTYILEITRDQCPGSILDTVRVQLFGNANSYFSVDTASLKAPSCQGLGLFCMNTDDLTNLVATLDGQPYALPFVTCNGSFFAMQIPVGQHEVSIIDTLRGCGDTSIAIVTCPQTDTVFVEIILGDSDTLCFANNELSSGITSLTNICPDGSFVDFTAVGDSCIAIFGDWMGQETACWVACDDFGFCDTTIVIATVTDPFPNGIADTITLTQNSRFCFDEIPLNIADAPFTLTNLCAGQSGTSVQFDPASTAPCLNFNGLAVGTDTACVEICDNQGFCDTIILYVTVVPGEVLSDTVFIHYDTGVYCLNPGFLPGNIVSVQDICPETNGGNVVFNIQDTCVFYYGISVGTDTACIRFEDEFGNVALTNLIVEVITTHPETFCDTIFIGEKKLMCLDTSELFGSYSDAFEFCPDERTGNADIFIEPLTVCVEYEGLTLGRDSACVVACDNFGTCDTTYFCILVREYFDPPIVNNDSVGTPKATPVVIDFLPNDSIFGGIQCLYVLDQPISGSVTLNLDNSFTYIPDEEFCARWDNFTYVACNPNGSDTATVAIYISCIELTVFTAVSPNNDGVNDFFYVAKIEEFPDNRLRVFNRWGNMVFSESEYKNTWPGTWGENIELPDGTYYYILEWTDNGVTSIKRGYFEMFR